MSYYVLDTERGRVRSRTSRRRSREAWRQCITLVSLRRVGPIRHSRKNGNPGNSWSCGETLQPFVPSGSGAHIVRLAKTCWIPVVGHCASAAATSHRGARQVDPHTVGRWFMEPRSRSPRPSLDKRDPSRRRHRRPVPMLLSPLHTGMGPPRGRRRPSDARRPRGFMSGFPLIKGRSERPPKSLCVCQTADR
jgi:hypothetical protein